MGKRVESVLFKGFVDKNFRVTYIFNLSLEGDHRNIYEDSRGTIKIFPEYLISLTMKYPGPVIYISNKRYFTFVDLLEKSVKLIQENLFELFPGVGKIEFDMDGSILERFQKEKALSSANITMIPSIYTDSTGTCSPGLRISLDDKNSAMTIPLEDALSMNRLFKNFEPNQYGMSILSQLIKIE